MPADVDLVPEESQKLYPIPDLSGDLCSGPDWPYDDLHRGYGKTLNWGFKLPYGAYSQLIAAYVIGCEFRDQLWILNDWTKDKARADHLVRAMWDRYASMSPPEVAAIVQLSKNDELGEIYGSRMNSIIEPKDNLDFMQNLMANYRDGAGGVVDTSRMDEHGHGESRRTTLEPVSYRWLRDSPRSFESELHRGQYANFLDILPNTLPAYLSGYFAGFRQFEMDVLDSKDKKSMVAHEFARNQQTGEAYLPVEKFDSMSAEEIGKVNHGTIDPDEKFPNARRSEFTIGTLESAIAAFNRFMPEATLAVDARNMSSVTTMREVAKHHASEPERRSESLGGGIVAPRKLAIAIKVYAYTLPYGYRHFRAEFAAQKRNMDLGSEDMKFWSPADPDDASKSRDAIGKKPRDRTKYERTILAARNTDRTDRQVSEADRAAIDKVQGLQPSAAESDECDKIFKQVQCVICANDVMGGDPRWNKDKGVFGFKRAYKERGSLHGEMNNQGSQSVTKAVTFIEGPDNQDWRSKLTFGRPEGASRFEDMMRDHKIAAFSPEERSFIQRQTRLIVSYVASFAPHTSEKFSVQLASTPALSEILSQAAKVKDFSDGANLAESSNKDDEAYRALSRIDATVIKDRLTLLKSAIMDNVDDLMKAIGRGDLQITLKDGPGKVYGVDEMQSAFERHTLSCFDRFSDFSMAPDATRQARGEPTQHFFYGPVQGRMNDQPLTSANQTGRLNHSKDNIASATTDIPVEQMKKGFNLAKGRQSLPSHELVQVSDRSLLPRQGTDEAPVPHGLSWGKLAEMPTKQEAEAASKHALDAIGVPGLGPYVRDPSSVQRADARRQKTIEKVRSARSR